jgi:anthranilate synthase component I
MSYTPDRKAFLEKATHGNLVPVWRELLADMDSPVSAYDKVREHLRRKDHASHTFLLESVEGGENVGRYSFIGGAPRAILRAYGPRVTLQEPGAAERTLEENCDPLDALKRYMSRFKPVADRHLPRFTGGAVGFLGYDCVSFFEKKVPTRADHALRAPDMVFMVTDALIIFDRVRHSVRIIANAFIDGDPAKAYDEAVKTIDALCGALRTPKSSSMIDSSAYLGEIVPDSNVSRDEFKVCVDRAKEYIRAGDIIQVVLSQRFETGYEGDSLDVYRSLRSVNPSPYMFCLDLGDSAMVGSSPEVHVRSEDGHAELRPIAGTRPRSEDPARDEQLAKELLADPKERAEHIMLVDLARNDLGRVCKFGSVKVPELMVIERYSHVMHIVSDVTGELRPDMDAYELMRATFPAGTVSGAPKIRAMEIIAELEKSRRGPYAGAVGYFSFNGNLDSCITIRTLILDEGKAYVQAGAGIVADSDPQKEYEETQNKARGMFKAVALARHFAAARKAGKK